MSSTKVRIENAKKAIDKLEKKIDRINKAMETGKNPYMYEESDLRRTNMELEDKKAKLKEYELKLEKKNSIPNVPVIEEFLAEWRAKAREWYKIEYKRLLEYHVERQKKLDEINRQYREKEIKSLNEKKLKEQELGVDYRTHRQNLKDRFSSVTLKLSESSSTWESSLDTLLDREVENKRKTLIERVMQVTGTIEDASGLHIGDNGEINGYIKGSKGVAEVKTISAGGWNIQCFHYRVLVNKIK